MANSATRTSSGFRQRAARAVAVVTIVAAGTLPAIATASDEDPAEKFRQSVLESWHWQPDTGVELTTTSEARDHLAPYSERLRDLTDYADPFDVTDSDRGVVLFRTDRLDLAVVQSTEPTVPRLVVAFDRDSGDRVFFNSGAHEAPYDFRFVEVTGSAPLEWQVRRTGGGGTGVHGTAFTIYAFDDGQLRTLLARQVEFNSHACPRLQSRGATGEDEEPFDSGSVGYTGEKLVARSEMTFRHAPVLALSRKYGCEELDEPPVVETTCRYRSSAEEYVCDRRVERRRTIESADELATDDPDSRAENIRWVLQHLDRLGEHGYDVPDAVREKLRGHLE